MDMDEHGAEANRCNESGSTDLTMLPLYLALKAVSDHQCLIDWCPEKSIFKLLYIFCLQDLKEPLETIRLLANTTEDVEKVSVYCVEHGEVIRLAALLMCAWDKLVPPNVEDIETSLVGEHIWGQIDVIFNEELRFMINCGPNCQVLERLKSKKVNLLAQWKFLKVLEIARDVIGEFSTSWHFESLANYEVPYEVACQLSEKTELVFKPDDVYCDDIKCLTPKLNTIEKAMLNEAIEKQLQLWSISPGPTTREADESEVRLQKKSFIKPMVSSAVVRPTGGGRCSLLSSMSVCSYHTWRDLGKPAEIRVPKPPLKIARPPLSMVSSSTKICARLLLCAKKIMK